MTSFYMSERYDFSLPFIKSSILLIVFPYFNDTTLCSEFNRDCLACLTKQDYLSFTNILLITLMIY